jgi:hypothetical protein
MADCLMCVERIPEHSGTCLCSTINPSIQTPTMEGKPGAELAKLLEKATLQTESMGNVNASRLVVIKGIGVGCEFLLPEKFNVWTLGRNNLGEGNIDLSSQEEPSKIWVSRKHAVIRKENSIFYLEDLNSSNGTYVNSVRVYPGQSLKLKPDDVIQIGSVQLQLYYN